MNSQDAILREAILTLKDIMDALDSAHPDDKQAIPRLRKCGVATRARKLIKEFYS